MGTSNKIHLVVIDPQEDFMDNGSLPVQGGRADMDRVAMMVKKHQKKLDDIHITLDSHHPFDISHPAFWRDSNGNQPPPFTQISHGSIKDGIWTTTMPGLREHALKYTAFLENGGKYTHTVWSEHCLIGSPGHNVEPHLFDSVKEWEANSVAVVDYVAKGSNYLVEHFGALQAEMPMDNMPDTQLNGGFLQTLQEADVILLAGEAKSHCVRATIQQIVDNIGPEHIKKMHLLNDCSSSIPAIPGIVDFPKLTEEWLKDMVHLGLVITDSQHFWA